MYRLFLLSVGNYTTQPVQTLKTQISRVYWLHTYFAKILRVSRYFIFGG